MRRGRPLDSGFADLLRLVGPVVGVGLGMWVLAPTRSEADQSSVGRSMQLQLVAAPLVRRANDRIYCRRRAQFCGLKTRALSLPLMQRASPPNRRLFVPSIRDSSNGLRWFQTGCPFANCLLMRLTYRVRRVSYCSFHTRKYVYYGPSRHATRANRHCSRAPCTRAARYGVRVETKKTSGYFFSFHFVRSA